MPRRERASGATRHICAAMYLHPTMAETLVREVLDRPRRAVVPSPGVDQVAVLLHALDARRRHHQVNGALSVMAVGTVVTAALGHGRAALTCLLIAWLLLAAERLHTHYGVLRGALGKESFDVDRAPLPPPDPLRAGRLAAVDAFEAGNVTVHSGYTPFVGHGTESTAWSFSIDLSRPAAGCERIPFDATELRDHVVRDVCRLDHADILVEERTYVHGLDIRADPRFLPDPLTHPVPVIDAEAACLLREKPEERVRPHLVVRQLSWDGDLAVTLFLRLVLSQSDLFVEASFFVLPPVREQYREVDRADSAESGDVLRIMARSLVATPLRLVVALPASLSAMWYGVRRHARHEREAGDIRRGAAFDYGARTTPREVVMDTRARSYFQRLDRERHIKVLERCVLTSLMAFLDEKGVDSGELVSRSTTILDQSLKIAGDATFHNSAVSVGAGSRARNVVQAVRGLPGGEEKP